MKLFEITDNIRSLAEIEDPVLLEQKTKELEEIFDRKALQIGKLCKEQEADIASIDIETKRLTERKQVIKNKIEYWKRYLLQEMIINDMLKIEDFGITLAVRTNPPSVELPEPFDFQKVPEQFRYPEWHVKKKKILDRFKKTGEIVPGVNIIADKKRLDIK